MNCTATDKAGNKAVGNFSVHVDGAVDQINQLIALIKSFRLNASAENPLISKLQDTLTHLTGGQTTASCSDMQAFINAVNDKLKSKSITATQANPMLTAATRIRAVLGCS